MEGLIVWNNSSKFGLNCVIVDPRGQKLKRWQSKLLKKNPNLSPPQHIQDLFNEYFFAKHSLDTSDIRLVVGLHPDEATEPLVDYSVQFSLDFAVIPCCVFSKDFPERRLRTGEEPTSYPQFCQFLSEKCEGVRSQLLPFMGRNKVLYKKSWFKYFREDGVSWLSFIQRK